jgi:hypothetical protein
MDGTSRGNTNIYQAQERIRHLHAVSTPSPRPGNVSVALCIVELGVACWHVWWVEHENVNCIREAGYQRVSE